MKTSLLFLPVLLAVWLGSQRPVSAVLILDEEARSRPVLVETGPVPGTPLQLASLKIESRIRDQVAVITYEVEVRNPGNRRSEATLLFPIPKGAQIDRFTLDMDGKPVSAELLDADKARGIYEDIVRRTLDPALLEYAGRDVFKVRAFPVEPGGQRKLTLHFTQLLRTDAGVSQLVLPLGAPRGGGERIGMLSVTVTVETKRPLKTVYSPSHKVEVRRERNRAVVGFELKNAAATGDFQLYYSAERDDVGVRLLTQRVAGEKEGYFVLLASPGVAPKESKVVPKDVVFVLDTSGSMAGQKIDQARRALKYCVNSLNAEDHFQVVRFATDTEPLFPGLVKADQDNRTRAEKFIEGLRADGSTAIEEALRQALALRPVENIRPFIVVFLTDGLPTVGMTGEEDILASVRQHNGGVARIFCFGLGSDVNTHLLDRIAEETQAFTQYVLPEEDIEAKVSSFFARLKDPALSNVRLQFPDGVRVTKLYPQPLPDLFQGDQLVVAGRFEGNAKGTLTVEGQVNGESRQFKYSVDFSAGETERNFIPRLWATRRVGYLLDEIRLRGESAEVRQEVAELARRYGIVTPYTAYLIVEDEKGRGVAEARRSLQELESDRPALQQSARMYEDLSRKRTGDAAVAGAQVALELKQADVSGEAQAKGNTQAGRGYSMMPAAPMSPMPVRGLPAVLAATSPAMSAPEPVQRAAQLSQQNRFVAGKNFFPNGKQWVDAEAQNFEAGKAIRLRFGSDQYFTWLRQHPETAPWLALGRNLQLVLGGQLYEIYDGPSAIH